MFNPLVKNTDTYFDMEGKMMLEQNESWNIDGDNGRGDALWRTGLAYISYGEEIIKQGIMSCYRPFEMINKKGKKIYQASRCSARYREDDVSRDQTIISLAALKVNGNDCELEELVSHLPFRLSRRFIMGPTMWCWLKAITGSKKYNTIFAMLEIIEFVISIAMSKVIRLILKTNKVHSQEEDLTIDDSKGFWYFNQKNKWIWLEEKGVNNGRKMYGEYKKKLYDNKFYKFLDNIIYPDYALHLTGWMVYTMRDGFWKKILQKLLLWAADKNNLLIKLQSGKKIEYSEIENIKTTRGYKWSRRLDGTNYTYELSGDDVLYNNINKDVLIALHEKEYQK